MTWTSTTAVTVGDTAAGTVTVTGPNPLTINSANLTVCNFQNGIISGQAVKIDGTGSMWICPSSGALVICGSGARNAAASMTISNGGYWTGGGVTLGKAPLRLPPSPSAERPPRARPPNRRC